MLDEDTVDDYLDRVALELFPLPPAARDDVRQEVDRRLRAEPDLLREDPRTLAVRAVRRWEAARGVVAPWWTVLAGLAGPPLAAWGMSSLHAATVLEIALAAAPGVLAGVAAPTRATLRLSGVLAWGVGATLVGIAAADALISVDPITVRLAATAPVTAASVALALRLVRGVRSAWDGPSLLTERIDRAMALAIALPAERRRALRAAMRTALESETATRRELGRCEEDAVADALRTAGPPRAFAQQFLFPDERLPRELSPTTALGGLVGGALVVVGLQALVPTPAALQTGIGAALGFSCGWRAGTVGWLAVPAVLSVLGLVLPLAFRSLEAAHRLEALCWDWLAPATLAAGCAALLQEGWRRTRARAARRYLPS